MKYGIYGYIAADDLSVFDFVSTGAKGKISKRVVCMPTKYSGIYNLAFGDLDNSGQIDDYIVARQWGPQ